MKQRALLLPSHLPQKEPGFLAAAPAVHCTFLTTRFASLLLLLPLPSTAAAAIIARYTTAFFPSLVFVGGRWIRAMIHRLC